MVGLFYVVVIVLAMLGIVGTGYLVAATQDAKARALKAARATITNIDTLAWDAREIDPHLSTQIIDEIRQYQKGKHK